MANRTLDEANALIAELARCLKDLVYGPELADLVFTQCAMKVVEDSKRALKAAGVTPNA